MERTKIASSNLESLGYDSTSKILEVEFKGGSIYQYYEVDKDWWEALNNAESKGSYFSKFIKNKFKCAKLDTNVI